MIDAYIQRGEAAVTATVPFDTLTSREREVLQLIAEGHTSRQIAASRHQRQDRQQPPGADHGQAEYPRHRRFDAFRGPERPDPNRVAAAFVDRRGRRAELGWPGAPRSKSPPGVLSGPPGSAPGANRVPLLILQTQLTVD
jgi:hypothetical protein